jgi:glycerol-3-phosphate acyltransferase PlsY
MLEFAVILIGYLLGSFPTAYVAGYWVRGFDIRRQGGGNMGALNVARELNPAWGLAVLLVDAAKGAGAVLIAGSLEVTQIWVYLAGFASIVGHCWPVFLKFRGGKGAATAIGVFFALAPAVFAICIPVMLIVIFLTSNVTLGMTAGFVLLPLLLWIFDRPLNLIIFTILTILFLVARYIPTALKGLKKAGNIRNFIIEKNYKPWQTKRK